MYFSTALVASAFAALAKAQSATATSGTVIASSTVSQSMPAAATAGFNAALISTQQKFSWCQGQRNNCPLICGGQGSTNQNTCDPQTLIWSCICSNGTTPDVSAYQETMPFYICEATFAQCMNNTPSTDPQGQAVCMANHVCGTRNASSRAVSSSSASSSASASRTSASGSGSATASASTTAAAGGAAMNTYSSGAFAAVLMVVLKLAL